MEIELTSSRPDGSWTWRAAGAREPRGVLDAAMAPTEARAGQVLRVEADFDIDGITITHVLPSREKSDAPGRIEIASRPARSAGSVTTSLVERRGRGPRRERPERPDRAGGRPGERAHEGRPRAGAGAPGRHERPAREGGPARPSGEGRPPRRAGTGAPERASREAGRGRPPRLVPGTVHRDALISALPIEQQPIAEQLAAGGLPAVRRALADERTAARAAGRPEVGGEEIIALAEQLAGRVKEAVWLDRAEAIAARLETVSLRDLRATVTAAAARDDAGRELLRRLREALDERVTRLRTTWERDLSHALEEGRVLQALRLSARPPEPTARLAAALVTPLADAASGALNDSTSPERWIALLEAAVASPVRRVIRPAALPANDPEGTARTAASEAAGRIPALARLLGLAMPPPPRPVPRRPAPAPRPRPPAAGSDATASGNQTHARDGEVHAPAARDERTPAQEGAPSDERAPSVADTGPTPTDAEPVAAPGDDATIDAPAAETLAAPGGEPGPDASEPRATAVDAPAGEPVPATEPVSPVSDSEDGEPLLPASEH